MKKLTLILLFLSYTSIYAQIKISGTVVDEDNNPLIGASVYINNTSIGTDTDDDGYFAFSVKEGSYELVVSYIGYDTKKYQLDTKTYSKPLSFKLESIYDELDEVVIVRKKKKKRRKAKEKAYFRRFKKKFLGESKFAKTCEITNQEVLDFDYDPYEDVLDVYVTEPLIIINKALGYEIKYDLVHFTLTPKSVSYLGNVKYKKLDGSEKQQKKWIANRKKAYLGSKMHFLRSLMKDQVEEQGFIVDLFERNPNPKRPTYKQIKEAERTLTRTSGLQRDPFGRSDVPNSDVSKAKSILEKAKLPEFVDKVKKKRISTEEYSLVYEGEYNLRFPDYLRVTYIKEAQDPNFKSEMGRSKYQRSIILLYNKVVEIRKSGVFKKPLDVFLQGYWAFEKVGDILPLDYEVE